MHEIYASIRGYRPAFKKLHSSAPLYTPLSVMFINVSKIKTEVLK